LEEDARFQQFQQKIFDSLQNSQFGLLLMEPGWLIKREAQST
jgi:hypothetical protein